MTPSTSPDQFASSVAADLRKAEHHIDASAMCLADAISATLAGRREAGLSSLVGQKAIVAAAEALHILTSAQGQLGTAHTYAERDAKRMSLSYSELIPTEPKPGDKPVVTPSGRLATV